MVPTIIFGAGIVGEVLFYICRDRGIKIECFCDNNTNKKSLCGLKVMAVKELKKNYDDVNFLISVADVNDVSKQLFSLGYYKREFAASFLEDCDTSTAPNRSFKAAKTSAGSVSTLSIPRPLGRGSRRIDFSKYKLSKPDNLVKHAINTCISSQRAYFNHDKLYIRSVDIIITECCSLKCRDCSNLAQYYEHPKDCDTAEIVNWINSFCSLVDEVFEFRIVGGEALMNKEFHHITRRLINEPKVNKIVIYTNGTIIPAEDQIKCCDSGKVLFFITDYGRLSKNLGKLEKLLSRNSIDFFTQKATGWTDCSKIVKHNRTIEQNKEKFNSCCAKNTFTLSDGKLYRCPFAANIDRLKRIPLSADDYMNICVGRPNKGDVRNFICKDFFPICDYCNGRAYGDKEIIPAIQINEKNF